MRYGLVAAGVLVTVGGLLSNNGSGLLWIQTGIIILAIGLATCEIVSALNRRTSHLDSSARLQQFRKAARQSDTDTMSRLLVDGGIPESIAVQTAKDISEDSDRVAI